MSICPVCRNQFADTLRFCPHDGAQLASPTSIQTLPMPTAGDPMIGQTLADRFHIVAKIGEGGMGAVYKATHTKMDRVCAVKIMSGAFSGNKDALARFIREAKLSSRLDHPHAVTIYDFGEAGNGVVYLAMEFVEGETLTKILERRGPLPVEETLDLIHQVAEAVEAAHQLNIVHRDLKPDNVMITRKGGRDWVKVLDFGIAKTSGDLGGRDLTATGMAVGTPAYMSPEQVAGEAIDGRSDLYSLALIVYQLLTGALPFAGANSQAVMVRRLAEDPKPLRLVNPSISPHVEAVVMRALARRRENRPPSVAHFIAELTAAVRQTNPMAPTVGVSTLPNVPPRPTAPPQEAYVTTPTTAPHPIPGGAPLPATGPVPSPYPTPAYPPPGTPTVAYPPPPVPGFNPTPTAASPQKSNLGLIIGLIVGSLLLGGGGVWGYFAFIHKPETEQTGENRDRDDSTSGTKRKSNENKSSDTKTGSDRSSKPDLPSGGETDVIPNEDGGLNRPYNLAGEWLLSDTIEETSYAPYVGLKLGYQVFFRQDGNRIRGSGEKIAENGKPIPTTAHSPIVIEGTIDGDQVTATFVEQGAKRTTTGSFRWKIVENGNGLEGRFDHTAATSSGTSRGYKARK